MSKHDFTKEEFAGRLARTRAAMEQAGLDWLLVIHPVSMRWLIGQDNKSYTAFQCLPVSVKPGKLDDLHARHGAQRVRGRLHGRRGAQLQRPRAGRPDGGVREVRR